MWTKKAKAKNIKDRHGHDIKAVSNCLNPPGIDH